MCFIERLLNTETLRRPSFWLSKEIRRPEPGIIGFEEIQRWLPAVSIRSDTDTRVFKGCERSRTLLGSAPWYFTRSNPGSRGSADPFRANFRGWTVRLFYFNHITPFPREHRLARIERRIHIGYIWVTLKLPCREERESAPRCSRSIYVYFVYVTYYEFKMHDSK